MGWIYLLTFRSGKQYVGQTRKGLGYRITSHGVAARGGRSAPVSKAWKKYGMPLVECIGEFPDDELNAHEVRLIAAHGTLSPKGYNITRGGDANPMDTEHGRRSQLARVRSAEVKSKVSAAGLRYWADPGNRAKRRKPRITDETRARLSAARKAEWAAGIRKHTPEMDRKTSETLKRRIAAGELPMPSVKFTPEVRARMRAAQLAYRATPEGMADMARRAEKLRGRKQSPESVRARSAKAAASRLGKKNNGRSKRRGTP